MEAKESPAARLGRYLRKHRKGHGWKLDVVARRSGMGKSYLSRIERGEEGGRTRLPPMETVAKLAEAYQVELTVLQAVLVEGDPPVEPSPIPSPDELIEQLRMVSPVAIPVVEHPAHAGHSGIPVREYVYVERTLAVNKKLLCVPVRGDCMAPRIEEGDRVIVDRDAQPEQGQVVLVIVSEAVLVRRYYRTNDHYVLRADSDGYPDIETAEAEIVGPVVEVRKRP